MNTLINSKKNLNNIILCLIGLGLVLLFLYNLYSVSLGFYYLILNPSDFFTSLIDSSLPFLVFVFYTLLKNSFLVLALGYSLILFFERKQKFIKVIIFFLVFKLVTDILDVCLGKTFLEPTLEISEMAISIIRSCLFSLIFIKLFQLSKTVKIIFSK